MKEITETVKRKLLFVAQEMFEHLQYEKDYSYTKWEQQFREIYNLYEEGNLSDDYLNIASQGFEEVYK